MSNLSTRTPRHAKMPDSSRSGGAEGNARLTSTLGALLLVMLFLEGVTILRVGSLLTAHVLIGVTLLPVITLKVGSTTWRFAKYYWGSPEYRRKGPPPPILRLLGPLVVVSSLAVVVTGVLLVVGAPASTHPLLLQLHQITFVGWFGVMTIHVLGHVVETASLAPRDWLYRSRRQVAGATRRQWVSVMSLVLGVLGAWWIWPYLAHWHFYAR